ncbi:MAG: hypothetical protein AB1391_01160 [Candidatus Micrarchaeota archaeon]
MTITTKREGDAKWYQNSTKSPVSEFRRLFEEGIHTNFRETLILNSAVFW